jgi:uncharacterized RDD family membrane protein YckC
MRQTFCRTGDCMHVPAPQVDVESPYAGFGIRLVALLIDALILVPIGLVQLRLRGPFPRAALAYEVLYFVGVTAYRVVFAARLGATPGKLATGLRIVRTDFTRIGWPESFRRVSVDVALRAASLLPAVVARVSIPAAAAVPIGHPQLVDGGLLIWPSVTALLGNLWVLCDTVALLLNPQRRALHDRIAGTVVVWKRSAEQAHQADAHGRVVD